MADSILGPEEVLVGQHPVFVEVKEGVEVEYELAPLERGEGSIVALTQERNIAHGRQMGREIVEIWEKIGAGVLREADN